MRISKELKSSIIQATKDSGINGIEFKRQWWLMNRKLSISDKVLRVWRSGQCQFTML